MLTKLWSKLPFIIIAALLALFPFLLVPFSRDFAEWNIGFLLFSAVVILVFYEAINLGKLKRIAFSSTPFNRGIIILLLSFLISSIFAPSFVSSLLSPLGLGIVIVLSIWYVLLSNILSVKKFPILLKIPLITGVIFSIFVILDNLSVFKLLSNLKLYNSNFKLYNFITFNIDPYTALSFLAPILIILGYYLYGLFKTNTRLRLSREILLVVSFFILLTASLLTLPFPSSSPSSSSFSSLPSLPYQSGWSIALDTLKTPRQAIFGSGVGNFSVAFNLNRPASLNLVEQGKFSGAGFSRSSNFILQLLTENGLIGLLAFLYLLWLAFKVTRPLLSLRGTTPLSGDPYYIDSRLHGNDKEISGTLTPEKIVSGKIAESVMTMTFLGFWTTVILMFIFPPNLTMLFLFFTFLGLISSHSGGVKAKTLDLANLENTIWIVSATLIFLIFLIVYPAGRAYLAELNYQQALSAISKNEKVGPVYSLLKSSTDLNPYLPKYHQTLSQTMLFWGISLTKKDNITEKDRQDAAILLQQAIAQAQQAISLNPQDAGAWQNLGEIYRNLISAVNGADSWAISAFSQAVMLDPNNPYSHFSLGSMFVQLSQWENSQRQFEIAVSLYPNFTNGYYNLAYVQKQQGRYQEALANLSQVIQLLPVNSLDFSAVVKEKTALQKFAQEATASSSLSETAPASPISPISPIFPISSPSAELEPKLTLPQTASPPAHFKP